MRIVPVGIIAIWMTLAGISMPVLAEEPGNVLDKIADNLGNFELSPVPQGSYWYDTDMHMYKYNQYEIDVACDPVQAKIEINGEYAGIAPGRCSFTGSHPDDGFITVRAVPVDPGFKPEKKILKGSVPLPKTMEFRLSR